MEKKEILRTVKFVLFSASAGLIQALSFTLMTEVFKFNWTVSNLIALALSVIWNFTLNRKFTFKSAANVPSAMLKAFAFYLWFYPLQLLLGTFLTEKLMWNGYIVEGITMVLNLALEYPWQKYFVFKGTVDSADNK